MTHSLTEWYPNSIKPVRSGVYQATFDSEAYYTYYDLDTNTWYFCDKTDVDRAEKNFKDGKISELFASEYKFKWRGILRDCPI